MPCAEETVRAKTTKLIILMLFLNKLYRATLLRASSARCLDQLTNCAVNAGISPGHGGTSFIQPVFLLTLLTHLSTGHNTGFVMPSPIICIFGWIKSKQLIPAQKGVFLGGASEAPPWPSMLFSNAGLIRVKKLIEYMREKLI